MAVVQKKTSYVFDGHQYKYTLVANDTLAGQLRGSFSTVTVNNINTPEAFWQTLLDYVGDLSDITLIFPSYVEVNYPEKFSKIKEFFPNIFSVLSTGSGWSDYTRYSQYFEFGELVLDGYGGNQIFNALLYLDTSSYRSTPITYFITFTPYGQDSDPDFRIRLDIPIYYESEIANDKFNEFVGNKISFLQIRFTYRPNKSTPEYSLFLAYASSLSDTTVLNSFVNESIPDPPPEPSTDPYAPGGYSGTGGGGGNYDTTSDNIDIPNTPLSISTGTGLFTAFNPTVGELNTFANKLWNKDPTTIDDWFRMLFGGDAFNAIIGLYMIPVAPDVASSPSNIYLGNWDTTATAKKITNQYKQVDFGSVTLSEFWGNSIDYSPYTRVQLALPYIGIVDVDTDDVIGSVNHLVYNIDVFSGAICAMLHCTKGELASVVYQWNGSCAVQLPITGQAFNNAVGAVMGVGAAVGGAIALASGPIGAAIGTGASLAVGAGAVSGAAANMFGSMKGKVQRSGNFSANSGALGIMTPYFIISRPVQSVPTSWQADKGYPANVSALLETVTGYTEISQINLEGVSGTEAEKEEIIRLLKTGVIF